MYFPNQILGLVKPALDLGQFLLPRQRLKYQSHFIIVCHNLFLWSHHALGELQYPALRLLVEMAMSVKLLHNPKNRSPDSLGSIRASDGDTSVVFLQTLADQLHRL